MGLFNRNRKGRDQVAQAMAGVEDLMAQAQQSAAPHLAAHGGLAGVMAGGGMAEQLAHRDRTMRLMHQGVDTRATILAVRPAGGSAAAPLLDLDLRVDGPSGPYDATTRHMTHPAASAGLVAGARIVVKVDPQDPTELMVWGGVPEAAPAAGDDRLARLEKLADLRSRGLISDQELQEQKARILAEG